MPTLSIDPTDPKYAKFKSMISSRIDLATKNRNNKTDVWTQAEDAMLAYIPETDSDAIRRSKRDGGKPQYTTIMLPYTYAQVMAAHTYLTSVFFARSPVHQLAGRNGTAEQQTQAMEALLQYQVDVGGMLPVYYLWLYDAPKYGVGIIGEYWDQRITQYGTLVTKTGPDGKTSTEQVTYQIAGYQGNCIYNVSPFDFLWDPRVSLREFQKGEFVAIQRAIPWNEVVKRKALGYYMNLDKLKGTGKAPVKKNASSSQLVRPDTSLEVTDFDGAKHPGTVHVYEFYVELTQKEWGLGNSTYPEKWVFTITQDYEVILGAQPLGLMHGMFPFSVAETELDAYADVTRGIPEIMSGVQNTMDWLLNSHFYNVRAALNNQFIGDPSRIMMKDVQKSGEPGFFFRVRPEAFGQDVRTMLTQIPVQDVTQGHMADLQSMFGIGERIIGINDQILGALQTGGRKTATEIRTSTGFGVNRLKTMAEYVSASAFSPHASRLLANTQQFYNQQLRLRVVGDAAMLAGPQFLQPVSPRDILGEYDFVNVDGTLPVDRMAQANLWKELLMSFRAIPQLAAGYDISKIFAWVAQLGGLKNINQFRIQMMPPQQLQQMAAVGNIVPLNQAGGPPGIPPMPGGGGGSAAGMDMSMGAAA